MGPSGVMAQCVASSSMSMKGGGVTLVMSYIALVRSSGAGPPVEMLYLCPAAGGSHAMHACVHARWGGGVVLT